MSQFLLEIVSPEGVVFKDEVDEVLVPTDNGQIGILPHHTKLYSKLSEGTVHIIKDKKEKVVAVLGGFIEVDDKKATVVSEYAVLAENIQAARAQEARDRARELLREQKSKTDFTIADRDLRKSILELKVTEKIKKRQTTP